jgi:hypothetical protein
MDSHHPKRPPDIPALLTILQAYQIQYVLIGSVAAGLYGTSVKSGDLDITPDLDGQNLRQLVEVLRVLEAAPSGPPGHWEVQSSGEKRWVIDEDVAQSTHQSDLWMPDSERLETLDHLFTTRYGNFDIVPDLVGTYHRLMERAERLPAYGQFIWVAHVDDLLATLTVPRRSKDADRVRQLREIQYRRGRRTAT